MNLFKRGIQMFSVSNLIVSFAVTGFLGNSFHECVEMPESDNSNILLASSDTEPASRLGEIISKMTGTENVKTTKTKSTKGAKLSNKTRSVKNVVVKKEVASKVTYAPAKYSEVTGNAVVEYAKKYLGLRYVSGGYSLSTGTDCSGFTKLIYKEFGVNLSRSAKGQASNGTYVRKSDLQKGDLVFYGTGNGRISHVGIYMGNGKVIHESNHKDGVKISSVNMMQYITARRVINSTSVKIAEEKLSNATTNNNNVGTNNTDVVANNSQNNHEESTQQENKTDENINNITSGSTSGGTEKPSNESSHNDTEEKVKESTSNVTSDNVLENQA